MDLAKSAALQGEECEMAYSDDAFYQGAGPMVVFVAKQVFKEHG
jgi:hypothetical protein